MAVKLIQCNSKIMMTLLRWKKLSWITGASNLHREMIHRIWSITQVELKLLRSTVEGLNKPRSRLHRWETLMRCYQKIVHKCSDILTPSRKHLVISNHRRVEGMSMESWSTRVRSHSRIVLRAQMRRVDLDISQLTKIKVFHLFHWVKIEQSHRGTQRRGNLQIGRGRMRFRSLNSTPRLLCLSYQLVTRLFQHKHLKHCLRSI